MDLQIDGIGNASLYGNFDSLSPMTVHGVAHAFRIGSNAIVTCFSDTGMDANGRRICSADLRLSVDEQTLGRLITQLSTIKEEFFGRENKPGERHDGDDGDLDAVPKDRPRAKERLGPPLG
ncbi:hypothetical protein ACYVVI_05650 [Arenicellales bacterium IMCC57338]